MSYLNPNLCKKLKCPWLAEINFYPTDRRIEHSSSIPYPILESEYLSNSYSNPSCFLRIQQALDCGEIPKEVQPMTMPVCQFGGLFTFQVPECCPNILEHDVLDVGNIISTQEKE